MKKKLIISAAVAIVLAISLYLFLRDPVKSSSDVIATAKKGTFQIEITTTGELEAKNSVRVMGPSGLRQARIWQVKIEKLIDEGTVVKKGDFIASLERSELADRVKSEETDLEQRLSDYTQTKLDSAIDLRQARDELVNLRFAVDEKNLILEQSQFEPPATIKQNQLNLEKAERAYEQAVYNYKLKKAKAVAQMQKTTARLTEKQREVDFLRNLLNELVIKAPEDGMVIYVKEWDGRRKTQGSMVSPWDPTVATLPDLSRMISKTYVNEVDIRKIKSGQNVNIGLDAFPEKKLTGKVISVANVGEQKPNSDSKVFQVNVEVNEVDTTLRPAMTTSNSIISETIENVLFIPLECLHNQGDSLTYVFKKEGINTIKQEVEVGKTNSNEAVIERGVEEGDKIYISIPTNAEKNEVVLLEEDQEKLTSEKR